MGSFEPDIPGAEVVPSQKFWSGRKKDLPVCGVVQHYTASLSERSLVNWMASDEAGNSAHLFNFRSGHIVQMVKLSDRALHAGEKDDKGFFPPGQPQPANVNHFTIGIENCNAGWLLKRGTIRPKFYLPKRMKNGTYEPGKLYKGPPPKLGKDHLGADRWWEPYTEKQVASNIRCLKIIGDMFPDFTAEGICNHSDVSPHRKSDPGPLWPHEYILSEVFGQVTVLPPPKPDMAADTGDHESEGEEEDFSSNRADNNAEGEYDPLWTVPMSADTQAKSFIYKPFFMK